MRPAVSPELALRYLRELSADLIAAAVLDANGRRLAGPEPLTTAAAGLLAGVADDRPAYAAIQSRAPHAVVVAARSPEHAVVAVHTPLALPGLVLHDLVTVLGDLAAAHAPGHEVHTRHVAAADPAVAAVLRASGAADFALQRRSRDSDGR